MRYLRTPGKTKKNLIILEYSAWKKNNTAGHLISLLWKSTWLQLKDLIVCDVLGQFLNISLRGMNNNHSSVLDTALHVLRE